MSWPRYPTTWTTPRNRTIRLQGTFSIPYTFYAVSVSLTNSGSIVIADFTSGIDSAGDLVRAAVKVRCGPWIDDPNVAGFLEKDGFTFQVLPSAGLSAVLQPGSPGHGTYDIYIAVSARINGLGSNTPFKVTTPVLIGSIANNGNTGVQAAGTLTLSTPTVISTTITGSFDLIYRLQTTMDDRGAGVTTFQEDFLAGGGNDSSEMVTVNTATGDRVRTASFNGATDTTFSLPLWDPYTPGIWGEIVTQTRVVSGSTLTGGDALVSIDATYTGDGVAMDPLSLTRSISGVGAITEKSASVTGLVSTGTNYSKFYSEWRKGWAQTVQGVLRNFNNDNIDPVDIEILGNGTVVTTIPGVTGAFSQSHTTTDYTLFEGQIRSGSSSPTLYTAGGGGTGGIAAPITARIKAASAVALGMPNAPLALSNWGLRWNAVEVTIPDQVTVDQSPYPIGGTGNWQATNGTLSEVAGALRMVVSAGTARGQFSRSGRWIGYRYLTFHIRTVGSANQPFTVAPSVLASFVTDTAGRTTGADGAWVDVTVDLAYQYAHTRPNQFTGLPQSFPESADGTLFTNATNLGWRFYDLAPGKTYEVRNFKLVKKVKAYLHGLSEIRGTVDGALTSQSQNTFLTIGEWAHRLQGDTSLGTNPATWTNIRMTPWYGWQTLVLHPRRVGKPAIGSSTAPTLMQPQDIYDEDADIRHLFGGGLFSDLVCPTEQEVKDPSIATYTAQAQYLSTSVSAFPGAGDVWSQDAISPGHYGDTVWRFGKLLRGAAYGLVVPTGGIGSAGTIPDAPTVDLHRTASPFTDAGSGIAEPSGYFHTGPVYGQRNLNPHIIEVLQGTPHPTLTGINVRLGLREYGTLIYVPGTQRRYPANLAHRLGYYARVDVGGDGNVYFRRTDLRPPSSDNPFSVVRQVTSGGMCGYPDIVLLPNGRLVIPFARERSVGSGTYDVWETYSDSDGNTWSTPTMSIPNGRNQRMAATKVGTLRVAYISGSPGTLAGTFQSDGQVSPSSVFTLQKYQSGSMQPILVEDDTVDIKLMQEGPARWILTCRVAGESDPSEWSNASDGKTWIRLT